MNRRISLLMAAAMLIASPVTAAASETDTGVQTDAGSQTDAGTQTDAGGQTDAGAQTDTGNQTDAGAQTDAGNQTDAGAQTDAGNQTDAGAQSVQGDVIVDNTNQNTQSNQGTKNNQSTQSSQSGEAASVQGDVTVQGTGDKVEIKANDKPYLSLGADLSDEQRNTVLSLMGIDPANLSDYDVVYVTNAEEHQYLDAYIDASQIGSKSLSSVVIVEREKGSGINISTSNITYCTVGMYKNALATAGVTDADIIVAGPTGISGTAALVGIFKAYQEMTGETIDAQIIDAALNELVITGQLEETIEGLTDEEVEEFIAYIKSVIAQNDLKDEASINEAIDDACEKYQVTLSDSERQQIVDLLLKITSLGIDLNGLVDYAESLYHSYRDGGGDASGLLSSIGSFFTNAFTAIADFFKGLFS
ncbi:MAG: DUF1002 domain-containing protein [Roseburia sp.]|nr:DUF1002 domain-containing protein [Roseburia sp.]